MRSFNGQVHGERAKTTAPSALHVQEEVQQLQRIPRVFHSVAVATLHNTVLLFGPAV